MKNNSSHIFALSIRSVLLSSSLLLASSAWGAGNLTDSPTIADLIYDPATGNVKMDTSEAAGAKITSFQLENYNTPPLFIPGNYVPVTGGTFNGAFKQVTTKVMADSDFTSVGFTGTRDFGNVFPTGLNQLSLQTYLKTAVYTGQSGSGQFQFDLVIVGASFSLKMVDFSRSGSNLDFTWTSRNFKTYDLVSSTDLSTPQALWDIYDPDGPGGNPPYGGYSPSGSGTNSLTAVPASGPRRFFSIVENNQVVFFEGFEGATPTTGFPAGWVAAAIDNADPVLYIPTAWEVGAPSNVGPTSAASGSYCAGTNIAGGCGGSWILTLTSPAISMPAGAPALLSFRQYIQTLNGRGDAGQVRVLNADTNALIGTLQIISIADSTAPFGWTTQQLSLPTIDVAGKDIKLEFKFQTNSYSGTSITTGAPGFYIDDVTVTMDVP